MKYSRQFLWLVKRKLGLHSTSMVCRERPLQGPDANSSSNLTELNVVGLPSGECLLMTSSHLSMK